MTASLHPELPYWQALATHAMVWAWPLYEMQRMRSGTSPRRTQTDGFAGDSPQSNWRWCNVFSHTRERLKPGGSRVVMPNNDTLYSNAWLDLSEGPLVLETPPSLGRYHVLGLLDYYTNPFAHIGTRTSGDGPVQVLVTPPGWRGEVPAPFRAAGRHILAPTPWVWLIGRVMVESDADLPGAGALQDGLGLRSLTDWQAGRSGRARRFDARHDFKRPFDWQHFRALVNEALAMCPPPAHEAPLLQAWKGLGLGAGQPDDVSQLRAVVRQAWDMASAHVLSLMEMPADRLGRDEPLRGWMPSLMPRAPAFGGDVLRRAHIAHQAIGALEPAEAIYPRCDTDSTGQPLHGGYRYRLSFPAGELPPVDAFWSITLYDAADKMLVDNPIDRYAIGDRTPGLRRDADGGLTLWIQHAPPSAEHERCNWLPAPDGGFVLCLRAYLPRPELLEGSYVVPAPERQ
ncbi:DUF1254 domain-containing protein [Hydrogenophaga atypica]|uniref:DUF1254 domain-containing protein n=1 Tax=Hydrogenophaga atypica TaxID=249409 RepID=A0ABW2QNC7_9BURK